MSSYNSNRRIGNQMRKLRESYGISLRSLAKALGYSAPYILDLEVGKRTWSPETNPDMKEFYLSTLERLKKDKETGNAMRQLRKNIGISLKSVAEAMNYDRQYISALEQGKESWSPENTSRLKESYLATLEKLKNEAVALEDNTSEENLRDVKIKQIIICLDGCSDERLDKFLATAEEFYLKEIREREELEFYRRTVEDVRKNKFPLNREFIYS